MSAEDCIKRPLAVVAEIYAQHAGDGAPDYATAAITAHFERVLANPAVLAQVRARDWRFRVQATACQRRGANGSPRPVWRPSRPKRAPRARATAAHPSALTCPPLRAIPGQVPCLTAATADHIPSGTLVRFRGMVSRRSSRRARAAYGHQTAPHGPRAR